MKKKPSSKVKSKAKSSDTATPKRTADILFRRNEKNEILIMHLEELESYYCIDGIAADFWELIDGKRSTDEICGILAKRHEEDQAYIASNAKKLLTQLKKFGLCTA